MNQERRLDLLLSDRFSRVSTVDMYTASPVIEQLQGPFLVRQKTQSTVGLVDIRAAECGNVAVSTFAFGRTVDIVPSGLMDAIIVTTAIKGHAGITVDGSRFDLDAGDTVIAQEEDHPIFLYEPDTEVFKVRFRRSRLEQFFTQAYGAERNCHLHFDTAMSEPNAAMRWVLLLQFLVSTLNGSGSSKPSALELTSIEELLMLTLLNNQPHNYAAAVKPLVQDASSTYFERAVSFINQHLNSDICLTDIAAAAYCSPRSIARAFKEAGEVAPMQYVRRLRLQRIRAELLKPTSQWKTIAEIAFQWGYRHLGEFNRQYRAAFRETPSHTRDYANVF